MVLTLKYPAFKLFRQLGLVLVTILFSACSTISTVNQPTVEDKSTPAPTANTAKSVPSSVISSPASTNNNTTYGDPEQTPSMPVVPVAPKTNAPFKQNPAVIALIDTAQQQQQKGDLYSAQTSLQRAQRIAPRDPQIYYELAGIHRDLRDYDLAEQVALKGISIVQGQAQQLHRFWTLIAQIRADSGDRKGASQAQQIADRY
ncbi:MAG: hypothetical protein RQ783_02815 [Gammaproteobacteria bacterium]|nr:hypothetical protein [Gammaproteobacteria bacterium]